MKVLNERISEWAYFFKFGQAVPEILNLRTWKTKRFSK